VPSAPTKATARFATGVQRHLLGPALGDGLVGEGSDPHPAMRRPVSTLEWYLG